MHTAPESCVSPLASLSSSPISVRFERRKNRQSFGTTQGDSVERRSLRFQRRTKRRSSRHFIKRRYERNLQQLQNKERPNFSLSVNDIRMSQTRAVRYLSLLGFFCCEHEFFWTKIQVFAQLIILVKVCSQVGTRP